MSLPAGAHAAEQHMMSIHDALRRALAPDREFAPVGEVEHAYTDKFAVAEQVTGIAAAGAAAALAEIGVTREHLKQLAKEYEKTRRRVTLRLDRTESCDFVRKTSKAVESDETRGVAGGLAHLAAKLVNRYDVWEWRYTLQWSLRTYAGTQAEAVEEGALAGRTGSLVIETLTDAPPYPAVARRHEECDITWLVARYGSADACPLVTFTIDRSRKDCRTPRRNRDVCDAMRWFAQIKAFAGEVADFFTGGVSEVYGAATDEEGRARAAAVASWSCGAPGVFVPVAAMMEAAGEAGTSSSSRAALLPSAQQHADPNEMSPGATDGVTVVAPADTAHLVLQQTPRHCGKLLCDADTTALLNEHQRALTAALDTRAAEAGATDTSLVTAAEGRLVLVVHHLGDLATRYHDAVDYLEQVLYRQLVAALGTTVTARDFRDYMAFHCRKVFTEAHQPQPFSYSVRQAGRDPEGTFAIEYPDDAAPIHTLCRTLPPAVMRLPLDAGTEVAFSGTRRIHAFVSHRFGDEGVGELVLRARARQFGGYIVLLGQLGGQDLFLPKHAVYLENKAALDVQLALHEIPTAKEFRKAVASISPEQQRFAKAYRAMQLEATLFGLLVVRVAPQMERVLDLPDEALVQELQLMQDVMRLFTEYQIPSTVLSAAEGDDVTTTSHDDNAPVHAKIERVRSHVAGIMDYIKKRVDDKVKVLTDEDVDRQNWQDDTAMAWACDELPVIIASERAVNVKEPEESDVAHKDTDNNDANDGTSPPSTPRRPTGGDADDICAIPNRLEARALSLDESDNLRPVIINVGDCWKKTASDGLLSPVTTTVLDAEARRAEKDKAFSLLTSLTRSGALPLVAAELHVIVSAAHCFDKALMDALAQDSVNPIEPVERSVLLAASTVHDVHPAQLLAEAHVARVRDHSPALFA